MTQLQSIREQRYDQIYPELDPLEIERARRFGNVRSFAAGESLWTAGHVAPGLMVILTGKVAVTERDQFDNHKPIGVHGPGNFLGELALLSGSPALVDAIAQEPVEALIIPSERLRALMIAEAELGERMMRALILRRVAILQAGVGGPIILGRTENGDVLRLEGFLRRNGHPHQLLNPETDASAKVLIERFHIDPGEPASVAYAIKTPPPGFAWLNFDADAGAKPTGGMPRPLTIFLYRIGLSRQASRKIIFVFAPMLFTKSSTFRPVNWMSASVWGMSVSVGRR